MVLPKVYKKGFRFLSHFIYPETHLMFFYLFNTITPTKPQPNL